MTATSGTRGPNQGGLFALEVGGALLHEGGHAFDGIIGGEGRVEPISLDGQSFI